jgi:hypothetical protein
MFDLHALKTFGWSSGNVEARTDVEFVEQLMSVGRSLGLPTATRTGGRLYDTIRPTDRNLARACSLSRVFGLDEFPLHVDTAHWAIPCRFLLLGCYSATSGYTDTEMLDASALTFDVDEQDLLHNATFRIKTGRHSFFASIRCKSRPFIRFDPGCMYPMSSDGRAALSLFTKERWTGHIHRVTWRCKTAVLIDNWRMLHARSAVDSRDTDRVLFKVSIV